MFHFQSLDTFPDFSLKFENIKLMCDIKQQIEHELKINDAE